MGMHLLSAFFILFILSILFKVFLFSRILHSVHLAVCVSW
jgi:hypothetical protein